MLVRRGIALRSPCVDTGSSVGCHRCSSVGRASDLGSDCRGFDSLHQSGRDQKSVRVRVPLSRATRHQNGYRNRSCDGWPMQRFAMRRSGGGGLPEPSDDGRMTDEDEGGSAPGKARGNPRCASFLFSDVRSPDAALVRGDGFRALTIASSRSTNRSCGSQR